MDAFLTVDEIGKLLKVERRTVIRLIESRRLHAVKLGRFWRVSREDFQAFVRGGTRLRKISKQGRMN